MGTSIIKQDINFYDKPLWFQNIRNDGLGHVWTDIDGYEYRSGYKLPDKLDMLILFYLMLKSQTNNYQTKLKLTRYEILTACELPTQGRKYYARVKDSLERWTNVTIKFQGTFYDGKKYIAIGFGIVNDYKIDDKTKRLTVCLNEDWMLKVKGSNFFKYLNFSYYKALKRPISRRLYEILSPKSYDGKEWSIHLTKLGTKLPIFKRTVRTREGEKEVIYASDVLVAIKPAINEINRLAKSPDIAEKANALPGDVFTLHYRITGKRQERVIHFNKQLIIAKQDKIEAKDPQSPNKQCHDIKCTPHPLSETEEKATTNRTEKTVSLPANITEPLAWIDTIPYFNKKRKAEIEQLGDEHLARYYPGIRREYDRLAARGERPKPGFVYKAYKEGWTFPEGEAAEKERQKQAEREKAEAEKQKKWEQVKQAEYYKSERIMIKDEECIILDTKPEVVAVRMQDIDTELLK